MKKVKIISFLLATINQTQFFKKFNNGFKIDFGKTFLRTTFSAASNYFLEMMS